MTCIFSTSRGSIQPREIHNDFLAKGGKIGCALLIITALGMIIAAGSWIPAYCAYFGIGILCFAIPPALILFCRNYFSDSPDQERPNPSSFIPPPPPPPLSSQPPPAQQRAAQPCQYCAELTSFYTQDGEDIEGRTLDSILNQNDRWLEATHNYIQWLFPLKESSMHNPRAPVLDENTVQNLRNDSIARQNALRVFDRMLSFYGLRRDGEGVEKAENWEERQVNWVTPYNHNYLRITRILKFMSFMGFSHEVRGLFSQLTQIYQENSEKIGTSTYTFWRNAVR